MSTNITNIRMLLRKLAEQGKLSHAYLFSGNDETQKEVLVEELLRALQVDSADRVRVAPRQEGSGKEITIAQMRDLSAFLSMTSWNSSYKAVQIQDAHCMNQEAQSAFLKLLEEPKGAVVLFLLTEYPDMLFDTIRSRTQEFKFYSFAPVEIPDDTTRDFQKIQKSDLATRFAYAKKQAEEPKRIPEFLHQWLLVTRQLMRKQLEEDDYAVGATVQTIRILQETLLLLRTTNVSPRLALERIMLNLAAS